MKEVRKIITKDVGIGFIIGFIVTVIAFYFGFSVMGININYSLGWFIFLFAVAIGVLLRFKGRFHLGHLPMLMGAIFIIGGLTLFWGTFTFNYVDPQTGNVVPKPQWWDLDYQQTGIFLIMAVIGIILFVKGVRGAMANWYFFGNIKAGRRR